MLGVMDEDMAAAATDTLYTKCISESVFGLLSLFVIFVSCCRGFVVQRSLPDVDFFAVSW